MNTGRNFPAFFNRKRMTVYVTAVIVFCLMSIMVPQAHVNDNLQPNAEQDLFRSIIEEDHEPTIEVVNWMLDFQNQDAAALIR